jgi:hypothetical protein
MMKRGPLDSFSIDDNDQIVDSLLNTNYIGEGNASNVDDILSQDFMGDELKTIEVASPGNQSIENMILQHFMDETTEKERKEKERLNKHRLNNIRHRQRKQSENAKMIEEVEELEAKLKVLQEKSRQRASRPVNTFEAELKQKIWKETSRNEKRKREDAEEENDLLAASSKSHTSLIKMYYRRIMNGPSLHGHLVGVYLYFLRASYACF